MIDLERIEQKLDLIIRHFNIDGSNKMPSTVRKEAVELVIKLLEKRKKKVI